MRRRAHFACAYTFRALLAVLTAFAGEIAMGQAPASGRTDARPSESGLEQLLSQRPVVNRQLTLDQGVEIALHESPVARGAAEEVQAAIGRLNAARAETRPWLSANTFASGGSNGNIISTPSTTQPQMIMGLAHDAFFDQNLMFMFPLYTGGRLAAMVRQAAAMRNASQADLAAQRQDVVLMTRMAYRDVVARQSLVGVARVRLSADQERLRTDRNRFEQGAIAVLTVRRDEAEVATAQQAVTNAQRDVEVSLIQLKTVMGIHLASQLTLSDANDYEPSAHLIAELTAPVAGNTGVPGAPTQKTALPADLTWLLRVAEQHRPELAAVAQRVSGAQADTSAARSAFLPQINAFAMGDFMQSRSANAFAGTTYGLVMSLPLYNGGERHAHVQTAEAERARQEQERERIGLQVAQEVSTALINLRAAEQNIRTAQAAQAAAEEAYHETLQRYEAGRSINVEVLDALTARTQAQSDVVQALYQYNVAKDQLRRAVGMLDESETPSPK